MSLDNFRYRFTYHGHDIGVNIVHDSIELEAPCSIPLVIAEAFRFMVSYKVWKMSVDGVEIVRTR